MTSWSLPWPAAGLSPNARSRTWHKRARLVKAARADACLTTKAAKVGVVAGEVPILLTIEFQPPTKAHHDVDNLVARSKAMLDGIADALGVDDRFFRIAPSIGEPVKGGNVRVTIG